MIPKAIEKENKKKELVECIEKLIDRGFINSEIWEILGQHKSVISGLKVQGTDYQISLDKIKPMLEAAKEILER